jgi:putative hydrolase of the HAD superfamily
MIRNIIFDLGNVLLSWKPEEYLEKSNYSSQEIETILHDIFRSDIWMKLDNGDLTTEQAIEKISLKSTLSRDEIAGIFDKRIEILHPLTNNLKLLPLLKNRGFHLFYLSNFPNDLFEPVVERNDFFRYFDGGFISSDLGLSKPDIRIYKILLDKYSLKPEDTLFIDDLHDNIIAARQLGIRSLQLDHHEKLADYIKEVVG